MTPKQPIQPASPGSSGLLVTINTTKASNTRYMFSPVISHEGPIFDSTINSATETAGHTGCAATLMRGTLDGLNEFIGE